jgi:hypothetical protein
MYKLTKTQKAKAVLQIIGHLNEIDIKHHLCIEPDTEPIFEKIAKRTGIRYRDKCEKGIVSINEYIYLTYDDICDKINRKSSLNTCYHHRFSPPDVSQSLKEATEQFEEKHIPKYGPCVTRFGEIFRAIQRIQYRAHNDGDLPWIIGSPTFMSYMYLLSEIDDLNYSSFSYNHETGNYEFEFTEPILKDFDRLFVEVDDSLCVGLDYTKYQLMDLMIQDKIKDEKNYYDSRDWSSLNKKEYSFY